MPFAPKILAFAGSTRKGSFNKRIVRIAAEGARAAGAEVTFLDLKELPLPLYDGDLEAEQGLPENALRLKALMKGHDGFLIAAPEYNGSLTGVLKNAIDWASRPAEGEKPLEAFVGKTAVLMSASPGALGGLRGLAHLRTILSGIQALVLPQEVAVPRAHEALTEDGKLKDANQEEAVRNLGKRLAEVLSKLGR